MRDMSFKLDTLLDIPRYVGRDTYQQETTTSLVVESRTFLVYGGVGVGWVILAFWQEDIPP